MHEYCFLQIIVNKCNICIVESDRVRLLVTYVTNCYLDPREKGLFF